MPIFPISGDPGAVPQESPIQQPPTQQPLATQALATQALATQALAQAASQTSLTNALPNGSPQERLLRGIGLPHVCLRVDDQTLVAVSTLQSQEVLTLPQERLTVMPNMPPSVMGLINHRSHVFWLLDLPQLLGLTPLNPRADQYSLAIVRVQHRGQSQGQSQGQQALLGWISLGLAVREVQGTIRLAPEQIQSPLDQVAETLAPYLKGIVIDPATPLASGFLGQQASQIWILDAEAIAQMALS